MLSGPILPYLAFGNLRIAGNYETAQGVLITILADNYGAFD